MRSVLFLVFIAFLSVGHAQQMATMTHDGAVRVFHYYIPSNLQPNESVPLLIALHGLTQTGSGLMDITQFNAIAESEHFIVCYPSGLQNAWNANMNVSVSSADDKGFIEKLVDYFELTYNSNPTRRYLCGMSNGGFMSHKMVCESSYCFAAIASVAGVMSDTTYNNCNPQHATPVLQIHGTADAIVPYNGGGATGASVGDMLTKYQQFYGANPTPLITAMPNPNLTDLSYPELHTYLNGTAAIRHVKIYGGGHQWPGINTLLGGAGTINMDFYSPQFIWDFLSTKSCASADSPLITHEISYSLLGTTLIINRVDTPTEVSVFNLLGQRILVRSLAEPDSISLIGLPTGRYLIRINESLTSVFIP